MPDLIDHIAYLSQEIGPRPAGTEEEQQAALYITEQMQKEAGLSAVIEDFNSTANAETPQAICCAITFIVALASLFFSILAIPAMILAVISGALFVAEILGKPILSKLFARGMSQNVIAKYEPGYSSDSGGSRRRKIVLVARYDSGKVRPELKGPFLIVLPYVQWATVVAMLLVPLLLIIHGFFFLHETGMIALAYNVVIGVCLLFVAVPLILAAIHKFSAYNESANANASGVSVLLDVARRVGLGRVNAAELDAALAAEATAIHGEEAARDAGLVPQGVRLVYETAQVPAPDFAPPTSQDRLASAKDAIAALTGHPVPHSEPVKDIASNLVQVKEPPIGRPSDEELSELRGEAHEVLSGAAYAGQDGQISQGEENAQQQTAAMQSVSSHREAPAPNIVVAAPPVVQVSPTVPDWYQSAQENAKKPKAIKTAKVQRSRYADALDAAVSESSSHFEQANRIVNTETEDRLRQMRAGIMEARPPCVAEKVAPENAATTESSQATAPATPEVSYQPAPDAAVFADDAASYQAANTPLQDVAQPKMSVASGYEAPMPETTTSMPPINVDELRAQIAPDPENAIRSESVAEAAAMRPSIVLPDIVTLPSVHTPVSELQRQRAPLADAEQSSKTTAKSLLNMLPSIAPGEIAAEKDGKDPALASVQPSDHGRPDLSSLPSLSGMLRPVDQLGGDPSSTGSVSAVGSFGSAGATGTFAPIGDELLQDIHPDDIYIDDVDDSAYDSGVTETGAFAGPGYVDMPKSRGRRLLDRLSFRKKEREEEASAQEWLDIEEDFDARSAGAARGGWESFQDQGQDSSEKNRYLSEKETGEDFEASFEDDDFGDSKRPWQGGGFSRRQMDGQGERDQAGRSEGRAGRAMGNPSASEELQKIYQFRNPDVDVEVWFVALGSELSNNSGMRAFLAEHGPDLRGSVLINLNALGAGQLCHIEKEGIYKKVPSSSRLKRFVKKAGQATGVSAGSATIAWSDSAASIALKHGFQAMSLMGMDGLKPARFAQDDDVLDNIDEEILQQNAAFVMELIKNI